MKRRTFIKSVLGFLGLPYLPQIKTKSKVAKNVEFRRWPKFETPNTPLFEDTDSIGWKMWMTTRILNDNPIRILEVSS